MVIKLKDPRRWFQLPVGDVISLEGQGRRPVRLEVNAVTDASFQLVYPDDKVIFLAAFRGMETIEFVADGPVEVWVTSESEVYFYTDEGRNLAFVNDGKVVFAKPHQRRSESEQIIYMQSLMLENERRRNAKLQAAVAEAEAREADSADSGGDDQGELPAGEGQEDPPPAPDPEPEGVAEEQPAS
ncbi:hypothetical protein ACFOOL_14275 [Devosia honganensis]|uniref:Uncharacterized protein n=1 Tax=Devosia honganensis TaxID=1610527 RepID=A0ABV7X5B0_9HYPH